MRHDGFEGSRSIALNLFGSWLLAVFGAVHFVTTSFCQRIRRRLSTAFYSEGRCSKRNPGRGGNSRDLNRITIRPRCDARGRDTTTESTINLLDDRAFWYVSRVPKSCYPPKQSFGDPTVKSQDVLQCGVVFLHHIIYLAAGERSPSLFVGLGWDSDKFHT